MFFVWCDVCALAGCGVGGIASLAESLSALQSSGAGAGAADGCVLHAVGGLVGRATRLACGGRRGDWTALGH